MLQEILRRKDGDTWSARVAGHLRRRATRQSDLELSIVVLGGALCPVAQAYDWQRLEHHLASTRLGINSAPQLRQISIRLVRGFRNTIGRLFVMRIFLGNKPRFSSLRRTRVWMHTTIQTSIASFVKTQIKSQRPHFSFWRRSSI